MRSATLTREETSHEGTFGTLETDQGFTCRTGELPWRDNARGVSCIPAGTYQVNWRFSPKHGDCWHIDGVPGRSDVEIHSANLMGNIDEGFCSQLLGCIAPGGSVETFNAGTVKGQEKNQKGVVGSGAKLKELQADLASEPFTLIIVWAPGVGPA